MKVSRLAINFTIAKPDLTVSPATTVSAVSGVLAVVVVAGLIVYFKKLKVRSKGIG